MYSFLTSTSSHFVYASFKLKERTSFLKSPDKYLDVPSEKKKSVLFKIFNILQGCEQIIKKLILNVTKNAFLLAFGKIAELKVVHDRNVIDG